MKKNNITVFLSKNMGLSDWLSMGTFDREIRIYKELTKYDFNINIISYNYLDLLLSMPDGIKVFVLPFCNISYRLYLIRMFFGLFNLFYVFRSTDILITNQAHNGGYFAAFVKIVFRKKLLARCGYVFGAQIEAKKTKGIRSALRKYGESFTFRIADMAFVPTTLQKQWLIRNYDIQEELIYLIPNYVDISIFRFIETARKYITILFVGRLEEEKRCISILKAMQQEELRKFDITFIGDGGEKEKLLNYANTNQINLRILDRVQNSQLNDFFNGTKLFVLPSIWEGHPKTLIEAMASGAICLGADSPGINNIIVDGFNGFLFDSEISLSTKINYALKNFAKLSSLRENGIKTASEFNFDSVFNEYLNNLKKLT